MRRRLNPGREAGRLRRPTGMQSSRGTWVRGPCTWRVAIVMLRLALSPTTVHFNKHTPRGRKEGKKERGERKTVLSQQGIHSHTAASQCSQPRKQQQQQRTTV